MCPQDTWTDLADTEAPPLEGPDSGTAAMTVIPITAADSPRIVNADDWELGAVAVAHRPAQSVEASTDVFVRESGVRVSERRLLQVVLDWFDARDPNLLVTWRGASIDLEIIRHRAWVIDRSKDEGRSMRMDVSLLTGSVKHHDISLIISQDRGPVSINSVLTKCGVGQKSTMVDGSVVDDGMARSLVERAALGKASVEEVIALKEFAGCRVKSLLNLYDGLKGE